MAGRQDIWKTQKATWIEAVTFGNKPLSKKEVGGMMFKKAKRKKYRKRKIWKKKSGKIGEKTHALLPNFNISLNFLF